MITFFTEFLIFTEIIVNFIKLRNIHQVLKTCLDRGRSLHSYSSDRPSDVYTLYDYWSSRQEDSTNPLSEYYPSLTDFKHLIYSLIRIMVKF